MNFCELLENKIFINNHKNSEFAKVFSLKTFPLYGISGCKSHRYMYMIYLVQVGDEEAELRASLGEKTQLIETMREQVRGCTLSQYM